MTNEQIILVKNSWRVFRSVEASFIGDVFYGKLFLDNPRVRKMFPKKMDAQYRKIIDMLNIIVARLDKMDTLTPDLRALAERHEGYGVQPEQYKLVGEALLWTLEKGLGNDWNDSIKEAWNACYTMVSNIMIGATRQQKV